MRASFDPQDDRGASSAEYALLAAAIAAMIVVVVFALGQQVYRVYERTCTSVATQAGTASDCE